MVKAQVLEYSFSLESDQLQYLVYHGFMNTFLGSEFWVLKPIRLSKSLGVPNGLKQVCGISLVLHYFVQETLVISSSDFLAMYKVKLLVSIGR